MGGCYSKNKYTMGDDAPAKKGKKGKEEEIKAENNGNLNASPNKLLDDKSIPFIDRCSGTLGDRSSIMEEDEKQESNEVNEDQKVEHKRQLSDDDILKNENIDYKREVKVTSTRTVTVKSSDDPEGTTTTKTVVLESSSDKPDKTAEEIFDEMKSRAKEHMENADNVEETTDSDGVKVTKYTVNQESSEDGVERKLHVTRVVTVSEKESALESSLENQIITDAITPEIDIQVCSQPPEPEIEATIEMHVESAVHSAPPPAVEFEEPEIAGPCPPVILEESVEPAPELAVCPPMLEPEEPEPELVVCPIDIIEEVQATVQESAPEITSEEPEVSAGCITVETTISEPENVDVAADEEIVADVQAEIEAEPEVETEETVEISQGVLEAILKVDPALVEEEQVTEEEPAAVEEEITVEAITEVESAPHDVVEEEAMDEVIEEVPATEEPVEEEALVQEEEAPVEEKQEEEVETPTPVGEEETPVQEDAPVEESEAPVQETETSVEEAPAPVEEDVTPVQETETPVEEAPASVLEEIVDNSEIDNKSDNLDEEDKKSDSEAESEKPATKVNFLDQFREDHEIHAVDFMRIFRAYDKDKSGYLDMKEMRGFLQDLLKSKGVESDGDTIDYYLDSIMRDADIDEDKKMELAELANVLPIEQNFLQKFPRRDNRTKAELNAIFDHYDKDNSGTIAGSELEALLRDMFTQEQQDGLIDESISLDDAQLKEYAALVRELYDIEEDGSLSRDDISVLLTKF